MKKIWAAWFLLSSLLISSLFAQGTVTIFGPRVFERSTGKPVTVTVPFSVGADAVSPFTMIVTNGAANGSNRVSSATIKVNGVSIFSQSDFNQQVPQLSKPVTLAANNILEVQLSSKPGSYLTINITATNIATAPVITIYSPLPDIITGQSQVMVTGKVEGSAGTTATINNLPLPLAADGTFSALVSLSLEGANSISVKASTASGIVSEITRTVIRDTQPPTLVISTPEDGSITASANTDVTGTVSDNSPVVLKVNDVVTPFDSLGRYIQNISLTEGVNTITAVATDAAGNQTTVTRTVRRDTQAPVLTVSQPVEGLITNQSSIPVMGTVTDLPAGQAGETSVTVTINGNPVILEAGGVINSTIALAEGLNIITIIAKDSVNNQTTVTRTVRRDTQAPIVNIQIPSDSMITGLQTIEISGTVTDSTTVTLTINGNAVALGAGGDFNYQLSIAEGMSAVTLVATDAAGNEKRETIYVRRDTESPIINLTSPADSLITNLQSVAVNGTILDSTTVSVTVNGNTVPVGTGGVFSYQLSVVEGLNTLTIVAADAAGNNSTSTRILILDTVVPTVPVLSLADSITTNQSSIVISGTVSDSTKIKVTANGVILPVAADGSFSGEIPLVEGINVISIVVTDAAGNQTTIERSIWRDSVSPVITFTSQVDSLATKDSTVLIAGSVSDLSTVNFTVNGVAQSLNPDHSFALEAALVEGLNRFILIAADAAGNETRDTINVKRDTQAPIVTLSSPIGGFITKLQSVSVSGTISDLTAVSLTINSLAQTINPDGTFSQSYSLSEGENIFNIVVTDALGNTSTTSRKVVRDSKPPVLSIASLANNIQTTDSVVTILGSVGDSTNIRLSVNGVAQVLSTDGGFSTLVFLTYGSNTITFAANDQADNTITATRTIIRVPLPPDPVTVAPPIDTTVSTLIMDATEFLYTGANSIQKGVAQGTINKLHVTILRGRVLDKDLQPLPGAKVTVLNDSKYGYTFSREDGLYDIAVNGGAEVKINFEKVGYLPAQRQVTTSWAEYLSVDDAVLMQLDTAVHRVDFTQPEVVQGTPATDSLGTRRPTLFFQQGTQSKLVFTGYNYKIIDGCVMIFQNIPYPVPSKVIPLPYDSLVDIGSVAVRTTEYTVGPNAEALLPAPLPPTVAMTFAFELTADEVLSTGARDVRFSQPVSLYLENVLNIPVGLTVPMGCYNRVKGIWETSEDGRVMKIVNAAGGIAAIDYNGDNIAEPQDTLISKGISLVEQQYLASLYQVGQTFWRTTITHLGTYTGGFGMLAPNAKDPQNPAPDRYAKVDRDNIVAGSVIGVQNQTLGESIPITNTPLTMNYKSDRVLGRREAYCLDIPLTGNSIPSGISEVSLKVEILGNKYEYTFTPRANLTYHFEWDGKDAYGRRVQGQQNVLTTITYSFPAQYTLPPDVKRSFGTPSGQVMEQYIASRKETKRTQVWEGKIGAFDILSLGIGGWSLSLHHGYDCVGKILYKGDSQVRSANVMDNVVNTVAGYQNCSWVQVCDPRDTPDGKPALQAKMPGVRSIEFDADGLLNYAGNGRILKIDSAGIVRIIAGSLGYCMLGMKDTATGIMANCGCFPLSGIAFTIGPDKSIYTTANNNCIWKISPDGEISRFAGINSSSGGFGGDGGPAINARFNSPASLACGKDGSLYIGDWGNYRIRKISPDGIITTIAGTGIYGNTGDGGPAIKARMEQPRGLTVGPDGSVYFCDYRNISVRRITPDGIVRRVAGTGDGNYGNTGDGGPAIYAKITFPNSVDVAKDGTIFIASGDRVRAVASDGYIKTVVGGGNTNWVENGPATSARMSGSGANLIVQIGPDNNLYASEATQGFRILKVVPPLPGITLSEILIASEDGSERYVFSYSGRHLRTLDALTGVVKYSFGYDNQYRLVTITDVDSLVTHVERDSTGKATAIVSPYGVRTQLNLDSLGYLLQAVNPAQESNIFTYTDGGLMTSKTDARSNTYHYEYDSLGYLTKDLDPVGGYTNLSRSYDTLGYTVTSITAMGKKTTYRSEKLPTGVRRFINTDPNGLKTITVDSTDGSSYTITPEGMNRPATEKPDPRFGMQSPLVNASAKTPGGLQSNVNQFRTITQMTGTAVTGLRDSISLNGKPLKVDYDGNARVMSKTSPEGRKTYSFFDQKGRIVKDSVPGIIAILYKYDTKGRKIEDNQGGRKTTYEYDSLGRQSKITNAFGRSVQFYYDLGDRLIKTVLPDSSEVLFVYDRNDNILSVKPPEKPKHEFEYSKVNLETVYTPPFAGDSVCSTAHLYTLDKEKWKVLRPDSLNITFEYGGKGSLAGIPKNIYFDRGILTNLCDTLKGQQIGVVSPNGDTLKFVYDGPLVKKVTWTGSLKGNVAFAYNSDLQVTTETVLPATGSADSVKLQYDKDGLLTTVGVMKLKYGQSNSSLLSDTVGKIVTNYAFDKYGATSSKEIRFDATILFRFEYIRDSLSRIKERLENIYGITTRYGYSYDGMGRLERVWMNDTLITEYLYDANGNRIIKITGIDTIRGIYDVQDRLLEYSTFRYLYTQNGDLKMKVDTVTGDTTRYSYDAFGNLRYVILSDGTLIEYLVDGSGKRVGKKVNGSVIQKWIYSDDLKILAELDSANNIVSRFVYSSSENIPEYMIRSGIVYRLIFDHVGSLRFVVNTSTGAIVQRIDYNEYGVMLNDSCANFTPFGFAGGLLDNQTKLIRFGSRDYEPELGRWLTKDPIGFNGNSFNLYSYVNNEPINLSDPKGLYTGTGHYFMTLEAASDRGYSLADARGLADGTVNADNGTQGTNWEDTRVHAMGAKGNTDRSVAYLATGAWVSQNYMLAIFDKYTGNTEGFYKEMGFALHAVQDQWSPAHNYQEWRGGVDIIKHYSDAMQINRDKAIESSILLLQGNIGAAMRH